MSVSSLRKEPFSSNCLELHSTNSITNSAKTHINHLSETLLHLIFSISRENLSECAQVSKQWKIIAYDPKIMQIIRKNEDSILSKLLLEPSYPLFFSRLRIPLDVYNDCKRESAYRNAFGECYLATKKYVQARDAFSKVLEIRKTALGEKHLDVACTFINIGRCYLALGLPNEAYLRFVEALKIRRAILKKDHHSIVETLDNIKRCENKVQPVEKNKKCAIS